MAGSVACQGDQFSLGAVSMGSFSDLPSMLRPSPYLLSIINLHNLQTLVDCCRLVFKISISQHKSTRVKVNQIELATIYIIRGKLEPK